MELTPLSGVCSESAICEITKASNTDAFLLMVPFIMI